MLGSTSLRPWVIDYEYRDIDIGMDIDIDSNVSHSILKPVLQYYRYRYGIRRIDNTCIKPYDPLPILDFDRLEWPTTGVLIAIAIDWILHVARRRELGHWLTPTVTTPGRHGHHANGSAA